MFSFALVFHALRCEQCMYSDEDAKEKFGTVASLTHWVM